MTEGQTEGVSLRSKPSSALGTFPPFRFQTDQLSIWTFEEELKSDGEPD